MNKTRKCIIIVFLIFLLNFIYFSINKVQAVRLSSNIDSINETKYPGYKAKLQELKKVYPNIELYYTGLDWETVIKMETVHSRNLVPKNYDKEWRCSICGNKLYDSGWYCASEEAVRYLMDPRLYLDNKNIFQFQKLDTSVGTLNTSSIKMATQGTFLEGDETIAAIYNAAKDNNINAMHLITRTIQEQGRTGTSSLSSGAEYKGTDGVTYKGLYNLFSIGATGKNSTEVITNGLARALKEGWISRALSITGGGRFIKDKYLNRGQNTLYFQKFDVDNSYDGLYWHQYMQNLFAAKNEASLMYDAYNKTKLTSNSNFEFIIPIYENMPQKLSVEPNSEYYGDINTDLKTMKIGINPSGREYIYGDILIAEWIDGIAYVPDTLPEMILKSTDGEYSAGMYVSHKGGLNYYYDRVIHNLDTSKEYYIEVKLTGNKNIGKNKQQKANINVKNQIGTFKDKRLLVKENKLLFERNYYYGEINTDLKTMKIDINSSGREFIKGEILIAEWIDGVAYIPKKLPEMTLKSTDGEYSAGMYVSHKGGLTYYYDRVIHNLDTSKEYYIEVKLIHPDNIATKQTQNANMKSNTQVGIFKEKVKIILKENKMLFEKI